MNAQDIDDAAGRKMNKEARCRGSNCPFVTRLNEPNSPCLKCKGPAVWKDENGKAHGRCRKCTSCPMNGLGLPVCWAACEGPNMDYTTDGESMVTLGGMDTPDAFVATEAVDAERNKREPREVVRMLDQIDGEDSDSARPRSFAGFDDASDEDRAVRIAERLLHLDGVTMEEALRLHQSNKHLVLGTLKNGRPYKQAFDSPEQARNWAASYCGLAHAIRFTSERRMAAEKLGFDVKSVTEPDGIVCRILTRLHGTKAGDWDSLRARAMGYRQTEAAQLMLVTKQAISKRDKKRGENGGVIIEDKCEVRLRVSIHR